jgi:hypothetical protein
MKKFIKFIQQMSKSVLPYRYFIILNNPYIRLFRLTSCISIIILFIFNNILNPFLLLILLIISYIYIFYQCIVITLKIYYTFIMTIKHTVRNINSNKKLSWFRLMFSIIRLIVVICGIPIINDTVIEIIGDIKYVIKQILFKRIINVLLIDKKGSDTQ